MILKHIFISSSCLSLLLFQFIVLLSVVYWTQSLTHSAFSAASQQRLWLFFSHKSGHCPGFLQPSGSTCVQMQQLFPTTTRSSGSCFEWKTLNSLIWFFNTEIFCSLMFFSSSDETRISDGLESGARQIKSGISPSIHHDVWLLCNLFPRWTQLWVYRQTFDQIESLFL